MSDIGKIIRVNALPPVGERENNVIYQVAAPGAATYTDYAIDANGDLKTHAVVEGSVPVELSDDHVSISDLDLIEEGITTQAEFNSDTRQKLDLKLEIPSVEGSSQDYPKIIGLDDNGNVAKLPAGDLGKNMMNADLTNISARSHTLNAPFSINTLGNEYKISGLPNKNTDVSNFQKVMVQNSAGVNAIVDNKNLLIGTPQQMTEAERTAWKTAMNGGWSTGTMSVAMITPPVVDKQNKNYWLTLRGANLNFNPTSFSLQIVANDGTTLIATIPNSQVQLYSDGLSLTFYYNFKDLPTGNYKLRLWNGVASYITGVQNTIEIVQTLSSVNLSSTTWEKLAFTSNQADNILQLSGGTGTYNASTANKTFNADDNAYVATAKSSQIIPANTNFYLAGSAALTANTGFAALDCYLGLMKNGDNLALTNNLLSYVLAWGNSQGSLVKWIAPDGTLDSYTIGGNITTQNFNFIISRAQGNYTIIIQIGNNIRVKTKASTSDALSLGFATTNSGSASSFDFNITECYLF